jgi:hypothetical protein
MPIVSNKFKKSMPILFCQEPKGHSFVLIRTRWQYKIRQENLHASGQFSEKRCYTLFGYECFALSATKF